MFTTTNRSTNAARLCKNKHFQAFMTTERVPIFKDVEYNAINALLYSCTVRSLEQLDTDEKALERYTQLINKFLNSKFGNQYKKAKS